MVALDPSARPLRSQVDHVVRYERAAHLALAASIPANLAAASGMSEPLDVDPPDPSPTMQKRLAAAILKSRRSIDQAREQLRGHAESDNFRVDPAAAYRAKQLLERGHADAEIRRLTGLGRKALLTIKRGENPRPLSSQSMELLRCPDCGGLVAADAPCLLCTVRAGS